MIEAFNEITADKDSVRECQVWLIKQKQTQAWKTTKATADAVYSILLGGDNLLASTKLVEMSLGGKTVKPEKVEAGTGFYQHKFGRGEITSALGQVELTKHDPGVAWGSLHWQYLEDIAKITPHTATPLRLAQLHTGDLCGTGILRSDPRYAACPCRTGAETFGSSWSPHEPTRAYCTESAREC